MRARGGMTELKLALSAGVAIAAVVLPGLARAQETRLQPIIVDGQTAGTSADASGVDPVKGYVAKKTTTGSKTGTDLKAVPQSVSVVGREELRDRGVVNKIDEALRYTPGVSAEPFGSDPDTDWFYIRGFDATQSGVFMDGLTLFSYGFGGFQTDPFTLERIEVLKGPASVLYGGASPGGMVNLVRKRPGDEPLIYTEAGINNYGNAYTGFDVNQKASDTVTYRVTGKVSGGDNYTDYSKDLRGFIMPQVTVAPDDTTSVTVYGYLGGLDQVHVGNGFLPYVGTVVDAPYGRIPRDAFYGEPGIDEGKSVQQMLGYEVEHQTDNGWTLSQNARYGHLYKHENGPYPYGYLNTTDPASPDYYKLFRVGFEATTKVDSFAIDNRAEREFDTGPLRHSFLAGIDYKYYKLDHVQASPNWMTPATSIDPANPVYGAAQPANDVYLDQVLTQQQIGVYAQDQIRFGGGWLATLNGRYDYVDTNSDAAIGYDGNGDGRPDIDYRSNDGALSGRAGLAYEFDNGVTPYISAATFFNPIVGISATSAFAPEKGHQFEAGVKYEPTFIDGLLTASVYQLTKQNVAVSIPGTSFQEQRGEVRSTGVELEGKINIDENWKLLASASYTDLEVTKDGNVSLVGSTPVLIPDLTASLWVDYTFTDGALEGVSLGGGLRHQGESYANTSNTLKVPSATLVDAAIRYEKNDWGAALNVNNLFDKAYVKGCQGESVCGYGDGRMITLSIHKKW